MQEYDSETLLRSIAICFLIFKGLFIMDLFILDIYCMLYRFLRMAWKLCFRAMCCKVTFVAVVVADLG